MPSYLYHLALELYTQPPASFKPKTLIVKPHEQYLPPPETDIFQTPLPTHSSSTWGIPSRPLQKRSKATSTHPDTVQAPGIAPRPAYQRRFSHRNGSSQGELGNSPVPLHQTTVLAARSYSPTHIDWRFNTVCIQSIDMVPIDGTEGARAQVKNLDEIPSSIGLSTKGRFTLAGPRNTEVGWGVVHLYRDEKETPWLDDDTSSSAGSDNERATEVSGGVFKEEDCTTLCILAVPSYMTPSDFLGFAGERTREDVSHFRLIRTGTMNKYMVLMKFREAAKARAWRKEWNGKLFNSMEPENCQVVFVKSIEFRTPDSHGDPSNFPANTNDPFTPAPGLKPTAPLPTDTSSLASSLSTKPLAPPTANLVELPTCPVCLERMDETTGLLTILCQHVFHCACLEKWRGTGCPVCRYTQNDVTGSKGLASGGDAAENECTVCGSTSNLWICLICGNIGCGRYDEAHAFAHYEATSHAYAMDVNSQHVWDYPGDGYVHRLIQNKADGKLVDLPAAYSRNPSSHPGMTAYGEDTIPREKFDNMGMEYTYLLTSQLESQRSYYEEQLERAVDKASQAAASADEAVRTASALAAQVKQLHDQHVAAQTSIASLEKDVARQTARAGASSDLARKFTKQYQEEKSMNESLMTRIKFLEVKQKEKDERLCVLEMEKAELAEQNRDLSFFISGGEKLKALQGEVGEEVQQGFVEVPKEDKGRRKGKGKK
ncbi:zf-UBP-domain-containing protein [Pseudovirgaria hyperparasitica]|uniref:Zf-UBP-domain-containing protein n=1 Tax=Pseudovirgaria hyperparasitica TaxID=470096 RepID=A0A6A6VVN0_9PEZI|nr:zf-UBP-domain-containing protein [Pseudovirgaria hyperparasitica]KAF2753919.1 zf-UBP-domain-containing protein [Pseudovirgaria hyperparasitica]